jgi:ubiquinone/menaquinone biosynthesis C-methylase UbiE
MQTDDCTPGYSTPLVSFMARHTAETHAGFFLAELKPGWRLLDAGCGPGTITLGLARKVAPGHVIGIDVEESQFEGCREQAHREALNLEFRTASVYELPFEDGSFDAVFSHALLEDLSDPAAAIAELRRVLKHGGLIGVRASDLGGLLLEAASDGPAQALAAYMANRQQNSKNPNMGRKLGRFLRRGGFRVLKQTASYEVITEFIQKIGPLLAQQFMPSAYCNLDNKSSDDSLFVALAWCEAVGRAE